MLPSLIEGCGVESVALFGQREGVLKHRHHGLNDGVDGDLREIFPQGEYLAQQRCEALLLVRFQSPLGGMKVGNQHPLEPLAQHTLDHCRRAMMIDQIQRQSRVAKHPAPYVMNINRQPVSSACTTS